MSLKNTLAYGDNWHLYEDFSEPEGLSLRIDNVTVFINKDILQAIMNPLKRLEQRNWAPGEEQSNETTMKRYVDEDWSLEDDETEP